MESPKLPNDIIMKIIRLADGGQYAHQKKMEITLATIKKCGDFATRYIDRHVEEDGHDWDRKENVLIQEKTPFQSIQRQGRNTYNFQEWSYAFFEEIDDHQLFFKSAPSQSNNPPPRILLY